MDPNSANNINDRELWVAFAMQEANRVDKLVALGAPSLESEIVYDLLIKRVSGR